MLKGIEYTQESAYLRGLGKFDEAIDIIENNIENIDISIQSIAWLAAFYAAKEKNDTNIALKYAKLVAKDDPNIPTIKKYLSSQA